METRGIESSRDTSPVALLSLVRAVAADAQLFGLIAVDMLPTDRTLSADQIAALELLADLVAVAVARGRAMATLRAELAERQRAEAALRESEERYRFVVEHTRDALYR